MNLFRWFFNLFNGKKAGYSTKDFWGRIVHYNKYGVKIGYTVKSFWGRRNRYDANWNLISYSVKNFWGGYNTYDVDGNLISRSYKNIFGGYTTYDKNGVKKRVSYKGFWNVIKHFDLEETCVYERGNVRRTIYSPSQTVTVDYVKNDIASKVNTEKVSQEIKTTSAVQTKQEKPQEYHSEGNKEHLNSSGTIAKEKIPVIPEEHKGVAIESYSKSVSDGQHIHKIEKYYQSVEEHVKTKKITRYVKLLVFKYKKLEEFPAIAHLCGNMVRVEPLLIGAEAFEFSVSEIEKAKEVHVTGLDMDVMDNEFFTCSMSDLGKEFEDLLPEYPFGNDGIYRIQYVFECGMIITEKSMEELLKIVH